jgi:hypothetical protein
MGWCGLAQDRNRSIALVKAVMNLWIYIIILYLLPTGFHKMLENYQVSTRLVVPQVVLSSIELILFEKKKLLKKQLLTPEDGQFRPKHVVILKILKSDKC